MCLIHRVLTVEAPVGIAENLVASDHQHGTRPRSLLQRPSVKTNAGARRLFFSGIESYNKLPKAIRELEVTKFKTRVTDWLLLGVIYRLPKLAGLSVYVMLSHVYVMCMCVEGVLIRRACIRFKFFYES